MDSKISEDRYIEREKYIYHVEKKRKWTKDTTVYNCYGAKYEEIPSLGLTVGAPWFPRLQGRQFQFSGHTRVRFNSLKFGMISDNRNFE